MPVHAHFRNLYERRFPIASLCQMKLVYPLVKKGKLAIAFWNLVMLLLKRAIKSYYTGLSFYVRQAADFCS